MMINGLFERKLAKLVDVTTRVASALELNGIDYRIVGGFAVFLHVDQIDPGAARLTPDVDVAVDRRELDRVMRALASKGFVHDEAVTYRLIHPASANTAIHLIFIHEKVRADYLEPVPGFSDPVRTTEGVLLAPVADLVLMKLTSYRLKDRVHIQDMDSVGLITPEIEAALSEPLRARLAEIRATE